MPLIALGGLLELHRDHRQRRRDAGRPGRVAPLRREAAEGDSSTRGRCSTRSCCSWATSSPPRRRGRCTTSTASATCPARSACSCSSTWPAARVSCRAASPPPASREPDVPRRRSRDAPAGASSLAHAQSCLGSGLAARRAAAARLRPLPQRGRSPPSCSPTCCRRSRSARCSARWWTASAGGCARSTPTSCAARLPSSLRHARCRVLVRRARSRASAPRCSPPPRCPACPRLAPGERRARRARPVRRARRPRADRRPGARRGPARVPGPSTLLGVNAVSFAVSAAAAGQRRRPARSRALEPVRDHRCCGRPAPACASSRRRPEVRALLACSTAAVLFIGVTNVGEVLLAREVLGVGGSGLAALVTADRHRHRPRLARRPLHHRRPVALAPRLPARPARMAADLLACAFLPHPALVLRSSPSAASATASRSSTTGSCSGRPPGVAARPPVRPAAHLHLVRLRHLDGLRGRPDRVRRRARHVPLLRAGARGRHGRHVPPSAGDLAHPRARLGWGRTAR